MIDWPAVLRHPPEGLRVVHDAGHAYAPDDPFGKERLVVTPDGGLTLHWEQRGQQATWTARVPAEVALRLLAAVADAGFPGLPMPMAPPGPGGLRQVTVRAAGVEASALIVTPLDDQPPFDAICSLADSLVAQVRGRRFWGEDPAPGAVLDVRRGAPAS